MSGQRHSLYHKSKRLTHTISYDLTFHKLCIEQKLNVFHYFRLISVFKLESIQGLSCGMCFKFQQHFSNETRVHFHTLILL